MTKQVIIITHAAIIKEQGEFGWMMSTAIVISLDFHRAAIVDGVSMTVATMKILLCSVPTLLILLLTVSSLWFMYVYSATSLLRILLYNGSLSFICFRWCFEAGWLFLVLPWSSGDLLQWSVGYSV